ncbi:MAG: ParB/RepB/Spo0J family partition protein, partial [Alphaproteobacteria bacterium]
MAVKTTEGRTGASTVASTGASTGTSPGSRGAKRLGRGLDAILQQDSGQGREDKVKAPPKSEAKSEPKSESVTESRASKASKENKENKESREGGEMRLALDLLQPNPDQPRKHFNEGAIASLAQSIRNHGLLQPIVVRPLKEGGGRYEIIAGERRWHAASLAGLRVVPVIVREMEDSIALQAALVENLQREDLSPVEEARAYERLVAVFGLSHEDVASVVAKSRPHITNMVRLLGLPEVVLRALDQGVLSPAHGRLLLQSPHPLRHTRLIIERKLTVAAFDRLLKLESRRGGDREAGNGAGLPDWLKDIAGAFAYHLG